MVKRSLSVMGIILGFGALAGTPALAGAIGTGLGRLDAALTSPVMQVGCWSCGWGGSYVAGPIPTPLNVPPSVYIPGMVIAAPQFVVPQVVVQPVVVQPVVVQPVVVQPVVVPQVVVQPVVPVLVPASCWHETDNRGYGYWGTCWGR